MVHRVAVVGDVIVAVFVVTGDVVFQSTLPDEVADRKHLLGAEIFSPKNRFAEEKKGRGRYS